MLILYVVWTPFWSLADYNEKNVICDFNQSSFIFSTCFLFCSVFILRRTFKQIWRSVSTGPRSIKNTINHTWRTSLLGLGSKPWPWSCHYPWPYLTFSWTWGYFNLCWWWSVFIHFLYLSMNDHERSTLVQDFKYSKNVHIFIWIQKDQTNGISFLRNNSAFCSVLRMVSDFEYFFVIAFFSSQD